MLSNYATQSASRVSADELPALVHALDEVRVSKPGTSLITLMVPAGYALSALTSFLKTERSVSVNIKSRV